MILILKHIAIEGAGTIETFFESQGYDFSVLELYKGEKLPSDLSNLDAVIVMGGPMNVYEEDKYPFLKAENVFIQRILKEEIPYLGICLGAQLLAKAAGAKVTAAPKKEIGWFEVTLTKDGKADPLFKGLPRDFDVFQWHGDTFEIPGSGKHLAQNKDCPNQALRVGNLAYGLQFHVEVTEDIIKDWVEADNHFKNTPAGREMINEYAKIKNIFNQRAEVVYKNFLKVIESNRIESHV